MSALLDTAIPLLITLVFYVSSNILCAVTVRERLKVRWYVIVLFVLAETILHYLLRTVAWFANIPLIWFFLWTYCRVVDVEPIKLLYIQLIVVTHQVITNNILYLMEGSSYRWDRHDIDVIIIVFTLTTLPTLWLLRKRLWPRLKAIQVHDVRWLWIIPLLFITMNLLLGSSHIQYLLGDAFAMPYVLMTTVFSAATAGTCFLVLKMLERSSDVAKYETDLRLMDMQLATEAKRFAELTQYMNEVRVLRHDMRHHLVAMEMMLDSGHYDKLQEYLKTYRAEAERQESMSFSENFVGDLIARRTQLLAKAEGIEVDIQCALPADCWINDTDLCVLLGNLTENAVNACKLQRSGRRYIRATAGIHGAEAVIAIENSCDASPDDASARDAAGIPRSTGQGIPSVQRIAEKYHGVARFDRQATHHAVTVLLYAPADA